MSEIGRDQFSEAVEIYNSMASKNGLSQCQKLSKQRKSKLKARLKDCGGLDGWRDAMGKIRGSPFLLGENKNGWKADFDFILQEKSFTKLMEGTYENAKPATQSDKTKRELQAWVDG